MLLNLLCRIGLHKWGKISEEEKCTEKSITFQCKKCAHKKTLKTKKEEVHSWKEGAGQEFLCKKCGATGVKRTCENCNGTGIAKEEHEFDYCNGNAPYMTTEIYEVACRNCKKQGWFIETHSQ